MKQPTAKILTVNTQLDEFEGKGKKILISDGPPQKDQLGRPKDHLVIRVPDRGNEGVQTPLNFGGNLLSRKSIICHQAIINSARRAITASETQGCAPTP